MAAGINASPGRRIASLREIAGPKAGDSHVPGVAEGHL